MSEITISTPDSIRVELAKGSNAKSKPFVIDLRVNSPGALSYFSLEKIDTAPAMVRLAKAKGLDAIAITDFYSAASVDRVKKAALGKNLTVFPGVMIRAEISGCNEVLLCCIFPEKAQAADISNFLQDLAVPAGAAFNSEYIVKKSLVEILKIMREYEAISFASRMDQTPSRKAAIPLLVEKYGIRSFDLAYYEETKRWFTERWSDQEFALFSFSNANILAQVGNRSTVVNIQSPDFNGLKSLIENF